MKQAVQTIRKTGATLWESMCTPAGGCGVVCCSHEGEFCDQLDLETKRCRIYATRFGKRNTVTGKEFFCAPMHVALRLKRPPPTCGYAKVTSIQGRPLSHRRESWELPVVAGQR